MIEIKKFKKFLFVGVLLFFIYSTFNSYSDNFICGNPKKVNNATFTSLSNSELIANMRASLSDNISSDIMLLDGTSDYINVATFDYNGNFIGSGGAFMYYSPTKSAEYSRLALIRFDIDTYKSDNNYDDTYENIIEIPGNFCADDSFEITDFNNTCEITDYEVINGVIKIPLCYFNTDAYNEVGIMIRHYVLTSSYETIYHQDINIDSHTVSYSTFSNFIENNNESNSGYQAPQYDLYVPNVDFSNKPFSLVVTIHGRYWTGTRNDFKDSTFFREMTANRFAVANIDYRVIDSDSTNTMERAVNYLDMLDDIHTVLNQIYHHEVDEPNNGESSINRYNIDVSQVCLWGYSAGGYLAMMYSYLYDYSNSSIPVELVISEGGPTDICTLIASHGWNQTLISLFNDSSPRYPSSYYNSTDINVNVIDPLTITNSLNDSNSLNNPNYYPYSYLVYSSNDETVPYSQGFNLYQRLNGRKFLRNPCNIVTDHNKYNLLKYNYYNSILCNYRDCIL